MGGGGNEWTKFTFLEMWGSSQYICNTKNIILFSVENPFEDICFPKKLDTFDCVRHSI